MNFSTAAFFLSLIASAAAMKPTRSLLQKAHQIGGERRLEQNAEAEYAFLANYSVKMIQCSSGETFVNSATGAFEYGTIVFRLCAECDSDSAMGCSSAFGEFVVGINTFTAAYLQAKRDEMNSDDDANAMKNWNIENVAYCQNYEVDRDAEIEEGLAFYVGPACTEDATGVKLALFTEETCQTASADITFDQISNGMYLPYSEGGLVGTGCESCFGANDRGEEELSEMCTGLYMEAGKCETGMEFYHYMGQQLESCEYIASLMPTKKKSGAGKKVGWVILGLVVVGAVAFALMSMKKKEDEKKTGLMS